MDKDDSTEEAKIIVIIHVPQQEESNMMIPVQYIHNQITLGDNAFKINMAKIFGHGKMEKLAVDEDSEADRREEAYLPGADEAILQLPAMRTIIFSTIQLQIQTIQIIHKVTTVLVKCKRDNTTLTSLGRKFTKTGTEESGSKNESGYKNWMRK